MKTIFSVCSGIGSIFQIFPLTVNQRPETATLLPSGLVYLLLCFLSKVSTHHLLRLFNLLLWRSIVTCNRCNIVSSQKCLTYTNQTFCPISFNRKLIKFLGWNISKLRGHVCFHFCVDVARILKLVPY